MKSNSPLLALYLLLLPACSCNRKAPVIQDRSGYIESVVQSQHDRLEALKEKDGWLNLAGIYWLKEGVLTIGSDSSNDIVFPSRAPAFIGILTLEDEKIHLEVNKDVELFFENKLVKELNFTYDSSDNPSYITHGDFAWYIMKRHHSLAIRLRDYKNPAIEALDHIPSYSVDPDYLVEAKLVPFDKVKTVTVPTPFQDYTQDYECPGELRFRLRGKRMALLPFTSGDHYFIIISDKTSGVETYGGGRFMYASADSSGRILLDFNKAYNPPCALTPFAACPMPPPENLLPVKIEAGEKVIARH
jgi:uncharacterized protein (DUF1684 family)